jgi:hypothetical protein
LTGLVKKVSTKYEFPNGKKGFEKAILARPDDYYDTDLLDKLDAALKPKFTYTADVEDATEDADGEEE